MADIERPGVVARVNPYEKLREAVRRDRSIPYRQVGIADGFRGGLHL